MACGPFARPRSVPGSRCLPPRTWDLPSAACGLTLSTRDNKPRNRGFAAVGFPAEDLAGFPGGTPPHPDLARRCTCAVTHIAPCFPPGAGAAQARPTVPSPGRPARKVAPPPRRLHRLAQSRRLSGATGMTPGILSSRVFHTCWFEACFKKVSPEAQYVKQVKASCWLGAGGSALSTPPDVTPQS